MYPFDKGKPVTPQELARCTECVRIPQKDIDTYLAQGWRYATFHCCISGNETYCEGYTLVR